MKIGIAYGAYPCATPEIAARLMRANGFETTFCGATAKDLDAVIAACRNEGIEIENFHAPFSHINDIWHDTPEGERMLDELLLSIDNCKKYGVPTLIVHLSSGDRAPRINTLGIERFERLMAYAKEAGVTIAYENQRKLANIALAFEEFEDATFCWDTGHEACFAYGLQYMPIFGKKLTAIHVHDNHCVHNGDEHLIPGDGLIDFDRVTDQLAEAGYTRSLMLELDGYKHECYRAMTADEYFAYAASAARRLADEVERKIAARS